MESQPQSFSEMPAKICMLGFTGNGKSTLCNELMHSSHHLFQQSADTKSCTSKIQIE
jgi:predicted GTPase